MDVAVPGVYELHPCLTPQPPREFDPWVATRLSRVNDQPTNHRFSALKDSSFPRRTQRIHLNSKPILRLEEAHLGRSYLRGDTRILKREASAPRATSDKKEGTPHH